MDRSPYLIQLTGVAPRLYFAPNYPSGFTTDLTLASTFDDLDYANSYVLALNKQGYSAKVVAFDDTEPANVSPLMKY